MVAPPIPDSYWVEPGRFLAGEYPGAAVDDDARPRLAAFKRAGVRSFIDLTEERERLTGYQPLLASEMRFARFPIPDGGCPSETELRKILDRIDAELDHGETIYVHCWGGHGRTGLIVGCWLVRHGLGGDEALQRLRELRAAVPEADWRESPETDEQRRMVRNWA